MSAAASFDWKNPDYSRIFAERAERLQWLRADTTGERFRDVAAYYATDEGAIDFVSDWGMTFDPRLAEVGLPTTIPFVLFPKQREFMAWALARWRNREAGVADKSRDWGLTWLAVSLSCTLCLFREGIHIGFGSRKEDYVDSAKEPKAMFHKARQFIESVPVEFRGGWNRKTNSAHMRIDFPGTDSVMTGEAGDNIGAGDRATLYWVDEAALIQRPHLIEASLSQTTNCRIDISTPRGRANPFADKIHRADWVARGMVFHAHWRDDPRKDEAWYAQQKFELDDVTLAQEVDMSYTASVANIVIPQEWVQAAIGLAEYLGFEATGERRGALDVADEGVDLNAFCAAHGTVVESVVAWSGKGSDTFATAEKATAFCDVLGLTGFDFDSDGLGAGIRGDARVINERRKFPLVVTPYRGSGPVAFPLRPIPDASPRNRARTAGQTVRTNGDYFENAKAQAWFELRFMCQRAYRARNIHAAGGDWRAAYSPDDLISFRPDMPGLGELTTELSQAQYGKSKSGKMLIDKAPDKSRSPNRADAVVIRYAPGGRKKAARWENLQS